MEKIDIIYLGIALISALFGVIMWVRRPQEKSELNDAVFDEKICAVKQETNIKYDNLKELVLNLRDNHIHTIQSNLDKHINESQAVAISGAERMGRIEAKQDMVLTLLGQKSSKTIN